MSLPSIAVNIAAMTTVRELRFNSYNTRRNLPEAIRRRRGEANFLGAFLRAFLREISLPCAYGRNFSVSGCGVADLLICQPAGTEQSEGLHQMHLMAFEMKLFDWRRAIHQAYRYRYYADLSIVVLPEKAALRAVQFSHLFDALGVGLWSMNTAMGVICRHVDPSSETGPLSVAKRDQTLSKLRSRFGNLGNCQEQF